MCLAFPVAAAILLICAPILILIYGLSSLLQAVGLDDPDGIGF